MKLKRVLSLVLAMLILLSLLPMQAMAKEESCTHHSRHTAACGYAEAVKGQECTHACGWDCYKKVLTCTHTHDAACGYVAAVAEIPASPCKYFTLGDDQEEETSSPHTAHDETCGYAPGVPGTPGVPCGHGHEQSCYTVETFCNHQHSAACKYEEGKEGSCIHTCGDSCMVPVMQCVHTNHTASCGYVKAAEASPCTFVCTQCGQQEEVANPLFEQLMATTSAEELESALLDVEDTSALSVEEILALMDHLETLPYEDEDSYDEAAFMLQVLLQHAQRESVCSICGGINGNHTEFLLPETNFRSTTPDAHEVQEGSVHYHKDLIRDEQNNMAIQIDAWTEGTASSTEIVLVVDQSASMYQTAGNSDPYNATTNTEGYYKVGEFLDHEPTGNERSEVPGYYVMITKSGTDVKTSLVRWNRSGARWEASKPYSESNGEPAFDDLTPSTPIPNIDNPAKLTWQPLTNWKNNPTSQAKLYKSLFGATIDAFYALVDQVKDLPNAKIALVGFSSPPSIVLNADKTRGGTGVFSKTSDTTVEFKHTTDVSKEGAEDDLYAALIPASENTLIKTAIRSLRTNYGGTCTEEGFNLANRLFKVSNEKNNYTSEDVNRVIVLFTDGEPTCYRESTSTYQPKNTEKYAIGASYISKTTYGATVYAFANRAVEDKQGTGQIEAKLFMDYVSSNYPTANYENGKLTNVSADDKTADKYKGYSDNAQDMLNTFTELGETIFQENNTLNTATEIRDTVTPYFDIGGNYNGGHIVVQEIPNTGTLDPDDNSVIFNHANPTTLYDVSDPNNKIEKVTLHQMSVTYTQQITNADGTQEDVTRTGQQIKVSNYDYGRNTVYPGIEKGNKLRLIIPIKPSDDFVGGNWANTNSYDSGIYPDGNINSPPVSINGKPATFPPPHADDKVEENQVIEADVKARAGATYLEQIPYANLLELVNITIDYGDEDPDNDLTLKLGEANYGIAAEDLWRLDYVFMETRLYDSLVDEDGNLVDADGNLLKEGDTPVKDPNKELKPGDNLNVRRDHAVIAEVYIWPRFIYVDGKPVLQPTRPENASFATGVIYLDIYYPTFVFSDVFLYYGQPLELATEVWGEKMDATDYVYWYTNQEYDKLVNPDAKPRSEEYPKGYTPLMEESYNTNSGNQIIDEEKPHVFFKVDPIDQTVDNDKKTEPVDSSFYSKFGYHMGKDPIAMNVRVYFTNKKDDAYDPDNPPLENSMRNAFFLHTRQNTNTIPKHKSGSKTSNTSDTLYWGPEFMILEKFCELTIKKVDGLPNETYIFHISRGLPNEYSRYIDETTGQNKLIQEETEPTYYTSVYITTDENGYGEVILKEMPVGVYTIEEDLEWSWRFKNSTPTMTWKYKNGTAGTGEKIYLLGNADQDTATATITNNSSIDKWLSGMSPAVENVFGKKKP